jgi:LAO/AO transport system kinase
MLIMRPDKDKLIARRKSSIIEKDVTVIFEGILQGDFNALSQGITLIESTIIEHKKLAQQLIQLCLPHSGNSFRIGVTGVPGVGKSTFIEHFGLNYLAKGNQKLAVLAIDPSSERSGGSILGDKTRMNDLSVCPNVFIRPSASGKTLGGVAQKTRETIILCEAAGFDHILIETVGVGQSETAVKKICDVFLLLMLAGAGDELQGIKRGIMEMADAILITKADGKNQRLSNAAAQSYRNALMLFPPNDNTWKPKVLVTSSEDQTGFERVNDLLKDFESLVVENNSLKSNRLAQDLYWLDESLNEKMHDAFVESETLQAYILERKAALKKGEVSSYQAADEIFKAYIIELKKD